MEIDPRQSYRTKVFLGVALVVIVGAAVAAWTVAGVSDTVRTERTQSVASEADVQDDTLQTVVSNLKTDTEQIAQATLRLREANSLGSSRAEIEQLYEDRATDERLTAVHLIDTETDEIVVTSDEELSGQSSYLVGYEVPSTLDANETALAAASDDGSWVVYSRLPSGNVVVAVTPLSYVDDRLTSVLDETTTRVVAADGTVVYDSRNGSAMGSQHTTGIGVSSPAVRAGLAGEKGAQTVSAANSTTGTELVVGHDGVDGTEWAVVSYAEPGALFQVVDGLRTDLFVLLGAITALLVGFVLTVERPALRELQSLRSDVETLREGELDTAVETDRADEIGDLGRGLETMRVDLRDQVAEAERATAEAETAREEAEALSEELVTKAEAYRESMNKLADGDFTVRVDPESSHDGIREVGETLNTVVADLEATLAGVQTFTEDVADSMAQLATSADEIEAATDEIARTVQEISAGTDEQRNRLRTVSQEMNTLSATVQEVASTAGTVADSADRAGDYRQEGRAAAEDAAAALDEVQTETTEAVDAVEALVDQIGEIQRFADVIADVADQTDMLALNANVEAARTDTDGDGFAVVADEIKALAEEAGDRADDIDSLVDDIERQTGETADQIRTTSDRIADSNDTVERAIEALYDIDEVVGEVNEGIADIDRATDDQAASTEQVAATVDEVTEIAGENAADASEVSAAVEQQTATVSEVARTAGDVADRAAELADTVAQFEVDPNGDAGTTGEQKSTVDAGGIAAPDDAESTGQPAPDGGE